MLSYCTLIRGFAKRAKIQIPKFSPIFAVKELRENLKAPKIESFDIILNFGLDPTNGEHMIRGNCFMPCGIGRSKKIGVFVPEEHKKWALSLGASIAGDDLLKEVKEGKINFEQVIATGEMIEVLKPLGRILGPKGLMPTTRNNTLIPFDQLEEEMKKLRKGMINYRLNKAAIIQTILGKAYFTDEEILQNFKAFMTSINEAKPKHLKKKYIKRAYLTTTYGKSIQLDESLIDVSNQKCELNNF
jgi:large subunit ribosomal protein L1